MSKDDQRQIDDLKGRCAELERRVDAFEALWNLPIVKVALEQQRVDQISAASAVRESELEAEAKRRKTDTRREQMRIDPLVEVTREGIAGTSYEVKIGVDEFGLDRWWGLSAIDPRVPPGERQPIRLKATDQILPYRWRGRLSDWQKLVRLSGDRLAQDAARGYIQRTIHDADAVLASAELTRAWEQAK